MAKKASVVLCETVAVEVGGEKYELRATLQAMRTVSQVFGGLRPAIERVTNLDLDATAGVIIAGAGLRLDRKESDALVEQIWQSDKKGDINAPVLDYLSILLNGGKPLEKDADSKATGAVAAPAEGNA